eukprot:4886024-Alexandrium_andersonii.AAC.1
MTGVSQMLHVTTTTGRSRFSIKLEDLSEVLGTLTNDSSVHKAEQRDITTNGKRSKAKAQRRVLNRNINIAQEATLHCIQRCTCRGGRVSNREPRGSHEVCRTRTV